MIILLLLAICGTFVSSKPTVIVIGAGPAGIAAATKLLEHNVEVLVLEAEPRIGGRINSVFFGNATVDMGAEWCHGETGNAVYDMVKGYNLLKYREYEINLMVSDRREVDKDLNNELPELFAGVYDPIGNSAQEGVTLGEECIRKYNSTVHERYAEDQKKKKFALMCLDSFHSYVLGYEGAFSWFNPSARGDFRRIPGHDLDWDGLGYKTVLDMLMKKFPVLDSNFTIDNKILLNQIVSKIVWDKDSEHVSVFCHNDVYIADHVIFTPSVGVLKRKHTTMFLPRLPSIKVKAINDLGLDAVMKVMLHFPNVWWPSHNFSSFNFIWDHSDKEMLAVEFPHGPTRDGRSWLLGFSGIITQPKNPNVLSAWITGDLIPQIEKTSDGVLTDGIMFVLDKFLGHKFTISRPDAIMRSNWYTNPHFKGSYSYQTVASRKNKPSSNKILEEPFYDEKGVPRILFAGEATHSQFYSTVHGAIETGWREADRIYNYLKK